MFLDSGGKASSLRSFFFVNALSFSRYGIRDVSIQDTGDASVSTTVFLKDDVGIKRVLLRKQVFRKILCIFARYWSFWELIFFPGGPPGPA